MIKKNPLEIISEKGSITVEAAIIFPIFVLVVFSIFSLIKVTYTHEVIQYALAGTVEELSASSYLLRISGLQDINSTLRESLEEKSELFEEHLAGHKNLNDIFSTGEQILNNPLDELKNLAAFAAKSGIDNVKTEAFIPLVKLYLEKYILSGSDDDLDKKLKSLNVENGYAGLNFNDSNFFGNENDDIELIVKYTINLPIPINLLPKLKIVQSAAAKAWLGGDDASPVLTGSDSYDVWSLDNFSRGRIIRKKFGANLPLNFPVIASYKSGKAVMIKSLDIFSKSYQDEEGLMKTLDRYLEALVLYCGTENPWGSSKIVIHNEDIIRKELLLVIPENEMPDHVAKKLELFRRKANAKGIEVVIKKYGNKKVTDYGNKKVKD